MAKRITMRTRIIFEFATLLVFLLGVSIEGLFFQYPKNVLTEFFQSLHKKKEMKQPPQSIHHYHLHYYPAHTQILTKSMRAPDRLELDQLHSNHLESLGWSDKEYKRVPEPDIYRTGSLPDIWPESSLTRTLGWEEIPAENSNEPVEPTVVSKPGIIVQMPLHQNIIVQQPPPKEEKQQSNPLVSFFQNIKKIKNSLFTNQDDNNDANYWENGYNYNDKINSYFVYLPPQTGRKF